MLAVAIPPKPNKAATEASTKKIKAQYTTGILQGPHGPPRGPREFE